MISKGLFISATGTGTGKTFVTRGIARALARRSIGVAAIKPIETGCEGVPRDAMAIARACNRPDLAFAEGLYRALPALAPYAASLVTGSPGPDIEKLAARISELSDGAQVTLVEGAGGLLVPVDRQRTVAELVSVLGLPLLVVARDVLGVISHTLTLFESAASRGLPLAGLVLTSHEPDGVNTEKGSNLQVLGERLRIPVRSFGFCIDDDESLAREAESAGLLDLIPGL
jgi:dethiobiotin synthetase